MAAFTVEAKVDKRFEGDFAIQPLPSGTLTTEDQAAIAKITAALDHLTVDENRDKDANYPDELLAGRRERRRTIAAELRSVAEAFQKGGTPAEAAEQAAVIQAKYTATVPKFGIKVRAAGDVVGAFDIVVAAGHTPAAVAQAYFDKLRTVVDALIDDEAVDAVAGHSARLLEEIRARRHAAVKELRGEADDFLKEELSAEIAADNALVIKGGYREQRGRLLRPLFKVELVTEDVGGKQIAVDLRIVALRDLPAGNDPLAQEKYELFVEISRAATVIRTVCQRIIDRADGLARTWWQAVKAKIRTKAGTWLGMAPPQTHVHDRQRAQELRDQYITKLGGIGRIGLEGPHTQLAKLALDELRNEFVAQEAGRIKNAYVRSLGFAAGGVAVFFLVFYAVIVDGCNDSLLRCAQAPPTWWYMHKNFLLAAAGAAIGTWLSFSARRVDIPFKDLRGARGRSLGSSVRVIFVVALTLAACLLFWTGAMNIEIGNLKTNHQGFGLVGSVALVVGLFCGLAERALATAISGRASAFVAGVGGR